MSDAPIWESRPVSPPGSNRSIKGFVRGRAKDACFAGFAWLVVSLGGGARVLADEPPRPLESRLREIVTELASPAYEGRRGAGGVKAGDYLIGQFRQLKLEPLFQGDFVQTVPGKEPGTTMGRNVGAMLRGSDPALRDQWVIVAAHFDHLGVRNGRLYPGADDNASGVAMMLEVARSIVEGATRPRRSIMFIGFDLEEIGLFGSRYFVAHSPIPLERVVLFLTADMISRSLGGVCGKHVFVMGTEHAPALRPWIKKAARGRPLTVGMLGTDILVLNRSDYGPFRTRSIPFLFFTTGENPRYHTPQDTPETLDYPKLAQISQLIHQVVLDAVSAASVPRWQSNPDNPLAEALTIREVLGVMAKNSEKLKIGSVSLFLINSTLHTLDEIAARGSITPEERARVIQSARVVLFVVF
ncbi:MAG: M20/M25/M40 family metallo-hydrolase [Isosphaeraceae bacterium]